jgi:hypothetical protein
MLNLVMQLIQSQETVQRMVFGAEQAKIDQFTYDLDREMTVSEREGSELTIITADLQFDSKMLE